MDVYENAAVDDGLQDGNESANTTEVAEQSIGTETGNVLTEENPGVEKTETGAEEDGAAEPKEQTPEENAVFANIRRRAEEEAQQRVDKQYAERFGHLSNPITGKPILSQKEYFDAIDAQEVVQRNEMLKAQGVDPSIIDQAIQNNPVVRQAQAVMERTAQESVARQIESDIAEISKIDSAVKNLDDVAKMESFPQMMALVQQRGFNLVEAYRQVNFEQLIQKRANGAKQQAVNQIRGKEHMIPTDGITQTPDGLLDVPPEQMRVYRDMFPESSEKELKEKYNRAIQARS